MTSEHRPPSATSNASLPVSAGERPALAFGSNLDPIGAAVVEAVGRHLTGQPALFGDRPDLDQRSVGDDLERVYTPDWLARFCVGLLPWSISPLYPTRVLEPHAGGGAFLRALEGLAPLGARLRIGALDIDPTCWAVRERGAAVHDFLAPLGPNPPACDRVIGNPPFDAAEAHVDRGLEVADEVAFLLPLSRWDAQERASWWQAAPLRHCWILPKRIWPGSRQIGFFWFDRAHATPGRWTTEIVSCP